MAMGTAMLTRTHYTLPPIGEVQGDGHCGDQGNIRATQRNRVLGMLCSSLPVCTPDWPSVFNGLTVSG